MTVLVDLLLVPFFHLVTLLVGIRLLSLIPLGAVEVVEPTLQIAVAMVGSTVAVTLPKALFDSGIWLDCLEAAEPLASLVPVGAAFAFDLLVVPLLAVSLIVFEYLATFTAAALSKPPFLFAMRADLLELRALISSSVAISSAVRLRSVLLLGFAGERIGAGVCLILALLSACASEQSGRPSGISFSSVSVSPRSRLSVSCILRFRSFAIVAPGVCSVSSWTNPAAVTLSIDTGISGPWKRPDSVAIVSSAASLVGKNMESPCLSLLLDCGACKEVASGLETLPPTRSPWPGCAVPKGVSIALITSK
jgi:hypothetical protein